MKRLRFFGLVLALCVVNLGAVFAQDLEQPKPQRQVWSFSGVLGRFDRAQLQRGFQVYREVCSNCHRLSIPFRTLSDPNGPSFSSEQIKTLAASYKVWNDEPDDSGKMFERPATPADIIPPPESFPNDQAAAAAFSAQRAARSAFFFGRPLAGSASSSRALPHRAAGTDLK